MKKMEGYVTPTLRNWSVAKSNDWIENRKKKEKLNEIQSFRTIPSPKVPKVIYCGFSNSGITELKLK